MDLIENVIKTITSLVPFYNTIIGTTPSSYVPFYDIESQAYIACDSFIPRDISVFDIDNIIKENQKCSICNMTIASHLYRNQRKKKEPCNIYINSGNNFCSQCFFSYTAHKK
jgi:hypothetical protein